MDQLPWDVNFFNALKYSLSHKNPIKKYYCYIHFIDKELRNKDASSLAQKNKVEIGLNLGVWLSGHNYDQEKCLLPTRIANW